MEIENWTGQIICNKKRSRNINFRVEPELFDRLKNIKNKSDLIREAVKEKIRNISNNYAISKADTTDKYRNLYKLEGIASM